MRYLHVDNSNLKFPLIYSDEDETIIMSISDVYDEIFEVLKYFEDDRLKWVSDADWVRDEERTINCGLRYVNSINTKSKILAYNCGKIACSTCIMHHDNTEEFKKIFKKKINLQLILKGD